MTGIGWPSHDEDEKARIARCYTEVDQPTGCPLCIARAEVAALRAENARLRGAIKEWVPALRKACVRVLPDEAQPWTWLALLGEARDAADALDEALAAEREEKEENRG